MLFWTNQIIIKCSGFVYNGLRNIRCLAPWIWDFSFYPVTELDTESSICFVISRIFGGPCIFSLVLNLVQSKKRSREFRSHSNFMMKAYNFGAHERPSRTGWPRFKVTRHWLLFLMGILGIKCRPWCLLGGCCTTELNSRAGLDSSGKSQFSRVLSTCVTHAHEKWRGNRTLSRCPIYVSLWTFAKTYACDITPKMTNTLGSLQ